MTDLDRNDVVLRLTNVSKQYRLRRPVPFAKRPIVDAVRDLSLHLERGRSLGLVGESGSGKSTVAMISALLEPATSGSIELNGVEVTHLSGRALRTARQAVQMVFQDPYQSLNPRLTVHDIVAEPLRIADWPGGRRAIDIRVRGLLDQTGIPSNYSDRKVDAFSGGQRQRIAIARALALQPAVLICDEPTSALDVSVQAKIINLLQDLQRELDLAILFISHDLNIVRLVADRTAVMFHGDMVEEGDTASIFRDPRHEYTRTLLAAVPDLPTSL